MHSYRIIIMLLHKYRTVSLGHGDSKIPSLTLITGSLNDFKIHLRMSNNFFLFIDITSTYAYLHYGNVFSSHYTIFPFMSYM